MKRYLLTEEQLVSLLADYHKLSALENGGVNNWDWYEESIKDYLAIENDEDFEECARKELDSYSIFEY